MEVLASSDKGRVREQNEDYYYVSDKNKDLGIYMLADGMGGYEGGEIASRLAIDAARRYIEDHFDEIPHDNKENILKLIRDSMEDANTVVFNIAKQSEELKSMGTTLEICLIYNNRAYIGHIGDSRIYRIRGQFIRKLTTDHSYVETLVKDGTITKEEAKHHPKKNMLMKALGCLEFAEPDVMVKNFQKGDIIVMTSDGLTNMVEESTIHETIINNFENSDKLLIDMANNAGGVDNITVVIIKN